MRAFMFVIAFFGFAVAAHAADDVAAGQDAIRSQEQAIGRDDAASAYSFAAPVIQNMFGDPETFMAMVRKGYAAVYRHKVFEFGQARTLDGKIAQNVHIVDTDGVDWDALYTLEQQPDGSMKIIGCMLSKSIGA